MTGEHMEKQKDVRKNIILCSDGTGNRGGYTFDSNVYKIYKAIQIHNIRSPDVGQVEQRAFYDNGVGTSRNRLKRMIQSAFGIGISRNVKDLYEYLALNYEKGAHVYIFGFSRGAATVRALNGFIAACGLIDGRNMSSEELVNTVDAAFVEYKKSKPPGKRLTEDGEPINRFLTPWHGVIDIEFIGVWDTVAALGFPKQFKKLGIITFIINFIFKILGTLLSFFFPHKFYNYELTDNVRNAYQALALDDERVSFWPKIWNESKFRGKVEQVWFAGMHSNVGGGYARAGMANVPLKWMMRHASACGLIFKQEHMNAVESDQNVHDLMYDSRARFGMYYRYGPRDIKKLYDDIYSNVKFDYQIKFHYSVIERMQQKTANYAPNLLPEKFSIVDIPKAKTSEISNVISIGAHDNWERYRKRELSLISVRKCIYILLLETTIAILGIAGFYWLCPPENWGNSGIQKHIADILNYFTPVYFEGLIEVTVVQQPIWLYGFVLFIAIYISVRNYFRRLTEKCSEKMREIIIKASKKAQTSPNTGKP